MARVTRADLLSQDPGEGVPLIEALAPVASGVNEDGTPYFLPTVVGPDQSVSGSLGSNNAIISIAVPDGYATFSGKMSGTWVGTVTYQVSLDGGTSWDAISTSDVASGFTTLTVTTPRLTEAAIPAGVTHIRAIMSPYTSGAATARIAISPAQYESTVAISGWPALPQGSNVIGKIFPDGAWWAEAPTQTLAAGSTFIGAARDCWGNLSGAATGAGSRPGRFRAHAMSDQTHALIIRTSDDNVNWDPVGSTTSNTVAGAIVSYIDVPVLSRYMRADLFNGGAAPFTIARMRTNVISL